MPGVRGSQRAQWAHRSNFCIALVNSQVFSRVASWHLNKSEWWSWTYWRTSAQYPDRKICIICRSQNHPCVTPLKMHWEGVRTRQSCRYRMVSSSRKSSSIPALLEWLLERFQASLLNCWVRFGAGLQRSAWCSCTCNVDFWEGVTLVLRKTINEYSKDLVKLQEWSCKRLTLREFQNKSWN